VEGLYAGQLNITGWGTQPLQMKENMVLEVYMKQKIQAEIIKYFPEKI